MSEKIKELFDSYVNEHNFSGVALIKRGDNTTFEFTSGYAHKGYQISNHIHTRFDTASITELFTASGIVLLESEGKLRFTDKIHDLVDLSNTEIPTDVEIRHLLTHTSGIADDADEESGEDYSALFVDSPNYAFCENKDFLKNFAYKKSNFKAGTAVRYNNCAFVLLGLVIEKISGKGYREFITERIFKPFGMQSTLFHAMDHIGENIAEGYYFNQTEQIWKKNIYSYPPIGTGDSGAYTTVYDLDRFIRTLRKSPIYEKMLTPQTEQKRLQGDVIIKYGYGFEFIERNGVITSLYKEGCNAGVCNITSYYPTLDTTFTILGNQDCNVWKLHDLVQELLLKQK
ncbi:MAG: serine hydrolase [Longicatena sp.]